MRYGMSPCGWAIVVLSATIPIGVFMWFISDMKRTHLEEVKSSEQQNTERTEERSQFWQKLVPWGKDETEKSE